MPGLDTNILVRWIVDDDPRKVLRVQRLLEEAQEEGAPLFVPSTVMLAFNALLETQEREFQDEPALERALSFYRQSSADFADCLHAGQCGSAGRTPMITFDEAAAPLPRVELLK